MGNPSSTTTVFFALEIEELNEGKSIEKSSCLKLLGSYLDGSRIGGRHHHAALSNLEQNPIVLPRKAITMLIIRNFHE